MEDMVKQRMSGLNSWAGKRVFLTGHTGFKGSWLALWLTHLGAVVRGYSLDPITSPNLFDVVKLHNKVEDIRGDIRDPKTLDAALEEFAPDVVFHLAAQALVKLSYDQPILTYETNVIGTARVLDAIRRAPSVRAVVVVTSDKCYENREWAWGYRECDPLGGYDPYSSSKACAEIVAAAFRQSYFPAGKLSEHRVAIATARAGNVIAGGDWSLDRLIPDLIRGFQSGQPVPIRRPNSIRPWQFVLEPLRGYLMLAEKLLTGDPKYATAFNFGPSDDDARPVHWIVDRMTKNWGDGAEWFSDEGAGVHEAGYLKLDASLARNLLRWTPALHLDEALDWIIRWHKAHAAGEEMQAYTLQQIKDYEVLACSI